VFGQKTLQFSLFLKIFLSQETVPESIDEDHWVALLRRQVTRLKVGAWVHGVGVGLVLYEWIRVDYVIY
jgi:hypothetical protein